MSIMRKTDWAVWILPTVVWDIMCGNSVKMSTERKAM